MLVNDALNLVHEKFAAEAKGKTDGDVVEKYQKASSDFPVTVAVATHIFAVQLIQQNMAQHMAQQKSAEEAANTKPRADV